jgi:hypothetical protein
MGDQNLLSRTAFAVVSTPVSRRVDFRQGQVKIIENLYHNMMKNMLY